MINTSFIGSPVKEVFFNIIKESRKWIQGFDRAFIHRNNIILLYFVYLYINRKPSS